MKPLEFKCPKCGGTRLDEVATGMAVYNEIEAVWPEETYVEYNGESATDEDSSYVPSIRFQCLRCEYVLIADSGVRARTQQELVEWINFNCTFSVETIREKLGVTEQQAQSIRSIIFDLEPLRHEGESISTAERYSAVGGINFLALEDNEPMFVMSAVTDVISWRDDWPTLLPKVWVAAHTFTGHFLAYSYVHKYYLWATIQDLHELEEQWKKKNN